MSSRLPADPWALATDDDVDGALEALESLTSRASEIVETRLKAYYVALDGATRFGLARAVTQILQGALGHGFMPNPAELRMQHDAVMRPYQEAAEREKHRQQMAEDMARLSPRLRTASEREGFARIYDRFLDHCADRDGPTDIEALRAKYDPALLERIPDRTETRPQGFERARYRNG